MGSSREDTLPRRPLLSRLRGPGRVQECITPQMLPETYSCQLLPMDHLTRRAPSHWLGACHLAAGGGSRKYYWLEEQRPCGPLGTTCRFCEPQCSGIEVPVYPYLAEMSSKVSFVQSLQTTSYLPLFLLVQKKSLLHPYHIRAHGPNLVPTHEDPSLMTGKLDGGQDG